MGQPLSTIPYTSKIQQQKALFPISHVDDLYFSPSRSVDCDRNDNSDSSQTQKTFHVRALTYVPLLSVNQFTDFLVMLNFLLLYSNQPY